MFNSRAIVNIIQSTLNRMDSRLINHGYRVAYSLMEALKYKEFEDEYIRDMVMVALLHDIGAYRTEDIDRLLVFETNEVMGHSIYGALFFKYLSPLPQYSDIILYHHLSNQEVDKMDIDNKLVIQLIHLIDRIDIYWYRDPQLIGLEEYLDEHIGTRFNQEVVDMFMQTNKQFNILDKLYIHKSVIQFEIFDYYPYQHEEMRNFLEMISYSIDFNSKHMVVHTIMTTYIAYHLAVKFKLPDTQIKKIYYGALLHDLGKVAIPVEILENPNRLTSDEMEIMKLHVSQTISILNGHIDQEIINIAGRHHERLDGSGYPLGLLGNELSFSERLVAVADVFSALLGERSYKSEFSKDKTIDIVITMVKENKLDQEIVDKMVEDFDEILEKVDRDSISILNAYYKMNEEFNTLSKSVMENKKREY